MKQSDALQVVMTSSEAAERWGITNRLLRYSCTGQEGAAPRFREGEFRKSAILVSYFVWNDSSIW